MKSNPIKSKGMIKNSIVAVVLITVLLISYYLVIFLPKEESAKQILQEQLLKKQKDEKELANKEFETKEIKCIEDGKKFHQEYISEGVGIWRFFEPKYAYNKKLGKCLYSGGYMYSNDETDWLREVRDVYTGELVMSAGSVVPGAGSKTQDYYTSFWNEHKDLLGL